MLHIFLMERDIQKKVRKTFTSWYRENFIKLLTSDQIFNFYLIFIYPQGEGLWTWISPKQWILCFIHLNNNFELWEKMVDNGKRKYRQQQYEMFSNVSNNSYKNFYVVTYVFNKKLWSNSHSHR